MPVERLVFLDESGLNLSMSRSHTWVQRGTEYIDRVPMNWGQNLTLLGAIRLRGWVVQTSMFATATKDRFVEWFRDKLLPKLERGDVVVMDNLRAHHDPRVAIAGRARGVRVVYQPLYSPDLNPIESAGRCKSSTSASALRALPTLFVASHIAPTSASRLAMLAPGSRMRATPGDSGDPWG